MNEKVGLVQQQMETMQSQIEEEKQHRKITKVEEVTKKVSTAQDDPDSEQEDELVNYRAVGCGLWGRTTLIWVYHFVVLNIKLVHSIN